MSAKSESNKNVRAGGHPVSSLRRLCRSLVDIFSNRTLAAVAAKNGTEVATGEITETTESKYATGNGLSPANVSNFLSNRPKKV